MKEYVCLSETQQSLWMDLLNQQNNCTLALALYVKFIPLSFSFLSEVLGWEISLRERLAPPNFSYLAYSITRAWTNHLGLHSMTAGS